jgi:conjugative transfer signal peptidase TraF
MRSFIATQSIMPVADQSNWEGQKGSGSEGGFVEQDKGPCGTVRHFSPIPQRTRGLFGREGRMSRLQYGTADSIPVLPPYWVRLWTIDAARDVTSTGVMIVVAAWLLIGLGKAFGILIANTDSAAPAGVYHVVSTDFHRGDLVAVCLPPDIAEAGLVRSYLRTGPCPGNAEPVGKIAAAIPGDTVVIERGGVSINGKPISHSGVAMHDSKGRPLRHVPFGSYTVAADQVWLFGFHNRRSWDARYFGPVPIANVRGALAAVLTW